MAHRVSAPALISCALALAIPASIVTHGSFQPVEARLTLDGGVAAASFDLERREPLFLEYELTLRASGNERPTAAFFLNDEAVTTVDATMLYRPEGGRLALPFPAVRAGANQLRVRVDGPSAATLRLSARVHNYYGIAPDFPRAAIVADAAAGLLAAERGAGRRIVRFLSFFLASLLAVWLLTRFPHHRAGASGLARLCAPSIVPWTAVAYGVATPLHVWMSIEALLVGGAVGLTLVTGTGWIIRHRIGVLRVAAVTAVTIGVLEGSFRLFNSVRPSFIFYSDAYARYRGQPGAPHFDTHLNSRGFNDVEHDRSPPASVTFRLVAIGDSFAFGVVPYGDNYLTVLETALASDGPVEVVNMGVAGTGPSDYLGILVNEGLAFQPGLVLVGVFMGNDFEVAVRKPYEYSFVATFFHYLWQLRRSGVPATALAEGRPAAYADDEPTFAWDRFLEIEVDRSWVYSDAARLETAVGRVGASLRQMRDISRRAGADFAVVLIPDEAQVDRALQDRIRSAAGPAGGQLDFQRPNRLVSAALDAQGIATLDLLPAFAAAAPTARLYKPQDTHWNLAGNRLAAAAIAAFVRPMMKARAPSAAAPSLRVEQDRSGPS